MQQRFRSVRLHITLTLRVNVVDATFTGFSKGKAERAIQPAQVTLLHKLKRRSGCSMKRNFFGMTEFTRI
jgi:hypothetical protein